MAHEVIMPALGMAQDTGLLVSWQKAVGDAVSADDILMEVETDKSTMEVSAGADGFVAELRAVAGQNVPVGQVIALITAEASDASAPPATVAASEQTQVPEPQPIIAESDVPAATVPAAPALPVTTVGGGRVLASPKARRLAAEAGLDLSRLAEIGLAQPFHAADVDTLRNLPATVAAADMTYAPVASHIGAEVPAEALDIFLDRMRDEGRVELSVSQIIIAFVAAALRKVTDAENLIISSVGEGQERHIYQDPDRLRLSAVKGKDSDAPSQLELRIMQVSYLTTIALSGHGQPVLSVTKNDHSLYLTLGFSEAQLTHSRAIEMMHGLTQRLADPMMALV